MDEFFLLYFSSTQICCIDEVRTILKKIDFLVASGKTVYILPQQQKELREWAELMEHDINDKHASFDSVGGKDTNFFDIIDIMLDKLHPAEGKGHMFWFIHYGEASYIQKFADTCLKFIPVMVSAEDKSNNVSDHVLHAHPDGSAKLHRCTWLHSLPAIAKHLGKDRHYHYSPKHGNATKAGWPGESRLWSTDEEATEQVQIALCYNNSNAAWLWDESKSKYLKFFYEGDNPQRQWHGFHIDPENNREINNIPEDVKQFYGHR